MTARIVTPAEAREMLATADRYRDGSDPHVVAVNVMRHAAPALAATVASEPERVEAAVDAERDAIAARIAEASVTWGALTRAEQMTVSAFADYLAGVIRGRRAP